ncbi:MAG: TetR/AcrR family transcriptional regulator [Lachnospiraceae bacterium]|nr:TetR/AcrR family transcriptional regulator [Lachnospiraceae bacterium]
MGDGSVYTNKKTQFTRMCISEAILELMQHMELKEIKISAVVKRAGVARMTFYNYYDSIYSALTDYLQIVISEYLEECAQNPNAGAFLDYSHILFSLKFFDRYKNYFLTLSRQKLHSIMLDSINQFMIQYYSSRLSHSVYEMYCYSGGLLNAFLKWEENGQKEAAADVAAVIYDLYHSRMGEN